MNHNSKESEKYGMYVEIKKYKLVNPSLKLQKYLEKIEGETGRQIKFEHAPYIGPKRPTANFPLSPPDGYIIIQYSLEEKYEARTIAHEATHGYLIFKEGYCRVLEEPDEYVKSSIISFLNSTIADIVIEKKLEDEGFSPYSPTYIPYLKECIGDLKENIDFYARGFKDDEIKEMAYTVNYVVNWGYLEFSNLIDKERKIIQNFNKLLQRKYPKQVDDALKIINAIETYDIFTSEGYEEVICELIDIWELGNLVEII